VQLKTLLTNRFVIAEQITYLNSVVMPDDESSEESEGNDDEDSSAEEDTDTP